jgi:hypothetical protein
MNGNAIRRIFIIDRQYALAWEKWSAIRFVLIFRPPRKAQGACTLGLRLAHPGCKQPGLYHAAKSNETRTMLASPPIVRMLAKLESGGFFDRR